MPAYNLSVMIRLLDKGDEDLHPPCPRCEIYQFTKLSNMTVVEDCHDCYHQTDRHRGLSLVCARQEVEADRRVSIWPVTSALPTAFGLRAFALGPGDPSSSLTSARTPVQRLFSP